MLVSILEGSLDLHMAQAFDVPRMSMAMPPTGSQEMREA